MEEEKIKRSVSDTLNSISGIKRAEPNPFLFGRIMEEIKERQSTPKKFTTGYVWKLALVFIVMAMLNIFTLINYTSSDTGQDTSATSSDISTFIDEYGLNNTTYIY
ncbi:MAG: hypothetical protein ABSF32_06140 [Ignavibacteria bacterium]|jgi:hypothetical protein